MLLVVRVVGGGGEGASGELNNNTELNNLNGMQL